MAPNEIYQFSVINALMDGVVEDGTTVRMLKTRGNQGLGTFARMCGELVMLDGVVYELRADGSVHEAPSDRLVPFAVATQFEAQHTLQHQTLESKADLDRILAGVVPHSANLFVAYRIVDGNFPDVKVRSIEGQKYPGQPLTELGDTQHVFNLKDVQGTVVGVRSPQLWQGFTVAGHHLHFITNDRAAGGHVLELSGRDVTVHVAVVSDVHVELPKSREFNDATLISDSDGIKKVES